MIDYKNMILNTVNSINEFNKQFNNKFKIELIHISYDSKKNDLIKDIVLKIINNDNYNFITIHNKIMNKQYKNNDLIIEKLNDLYIFNDKITL